MNSTDIQQLRKASLDALAAKLRNGRGDLLEHLIAAIARIPQGSSGDASIIPYRYERSTDRCEETFDIYGPDEESPLVSIRTWDAEAQAEEAARRITAILNTREEQQSTRGGVRP